MTCEMLGFDYLIERHTDWYGSYRAEGYLICVQPTEPSNFLTGPVRCLLYTGLR